MIATFLSPSRPEPVGGVIVTYELADGLARRLVLSQSTVAEEGQ